MDQAHPGQHRRVVSPAPPPTPIARAVGKKSATVINDETLSEYLAKSLTVPELYLPGSRRLSREERHHLRPLVCVEFSSKLVNNEVASRMVIEAAKDLGMFQIVGHKISGQETRSVMEKVEQMFLTQKCIKDESKRESLKYTSRTSKTYPEATKFSDEIENILGTIEKVSEELGPVLFKDNQTLKNSALKKEAVFWFHKYYHDNMTSYMTHASAMGISVKPNPLYRLHFQLGISELHVQSTESYESFKTESGSIIVTIGKGVKDWSDEYKSFPWEPIFISKDNKPSFVIECMCYPVSNSHEHNADTKYISMTDQMFIAITFIILYKFLAFIAAKFMTSLI